MYNSENIEEFLRANSVDYSKAEHPPVFTVAEANNVEINLSGIDTKNLFLRDKKGTKHFLIVLEHQTKINLKELAKDLEVSKLSFASPDRLKKYLNVEPGSVSILGILNDREKEVKLYVEKQVYNSEFILCHPLVNTATLSVKTDLLLSLLETKGVEIKVAEF